MGQIFIFMTLLVIGGIHGGGLEAIADRVMKKIGRTNKEFLFERKEPVSANASDNVGHLHEQNFGQENWYS